MCNTLSFYTDNECLLEEYDNGSHFTSDELVLLTQIYNSSCIDRNSSCHCTANSDLIMCSLHPNENNVTLSALVPAASVTCQDVIVTCEDILICTTLKATIQVNNCKSIILVFNEATCHVVLTITV